MTTPFPNIVESDGRTAYGGRKNEPSKIADWAVAEKPVRALCPAD